MIDQRPQPLPPFLAGLVARPLGSEDGIALEMLHQHVLDALEDSDLFWVEMEPMEMFAKYGNGRGAIIGAFDGNHLVGYGALCLPGADGPVRGADHLLPLSDLPRVAHLSSAMVLPAYRGRGLHRWLLQRRIEIAVGLGRRHLVSTAAPKNHCSWGNMVRAGLAIKRLITVGDGLLRCLIHRDLDSQVHFDAEALVICDCTDIEHQRALLADGYWGCGKGRYADGRVHMLFGRPTIGGGL